MPKTSNYWFIIYYIYYKVKKKLSPKKQYILQKVKSTNISFLKTLFYFFYIAQIIKLLANNITLLNK